MTRAIPTYNGLGLQTGWTSADGNVTTAATYADATGSGVADSIASFTAADGSYWTFAYNFNNQVTSAQNFNSSNSLQTSVDYVYDVFGDLISRTVTISGISTTQKFAYDVSGAGIGINAHINPIWADLDASGNITTRYLTDGSGTLLARTGSTGTFWLLTDRLGSVRDVLNSSGSLVDQVSYDISGNITSETDQTITGEWGFGGSRIDRALNMPMDGYRFVLPDGQFSGVDELGFGAGDPNTRRFAGNNGANHADPSGLDAIVLFKADGAAGSGHMAVLIGRDKTPAELATWGANVDVDPNGKYVGGWRYYSFTPDGSTRAAWSGIANLEVKPKKSELGRQFANIPDALQDQNLKPYSNFLWLRSDDSKVTKAFEQGEKRKEMMYTLSNNCVNAVADVVGKAGLSLQVKTAKEDMTLALNVGAVVRAPKQIVERAFDIGGAIVDAFSGEESKPTPTTMENWSKIAAPRPTYTATIQSYTGKETRVLAGSWPAFAEHTDAFLKLIGKK